MIMCSYSGSPLSQLLRIFAGANVLGYLTFISSLISLGPNLLVSYNAQDPILPGAHVSVLGVLVFKWRLTAVFCDLIELDIY